MSSRKSCVKILNFKCPCNLHDGKSSALCTAFCKTGLNGRNEINKMTLHWISSQIFKDMVICFENSDRPRLFCNAIWRIIVSVRPFSGRLRSSTVCCVIWCRRTQWWVDFIMIVSLETNWSNARLLLLICRLKHRV